MEKVNYKMRMLSPEEAQENRIDAILVNLIKIFPDPLPELCWFDLISFIYYLSRKTNTFYKSDILTYIQRHINHGENIDNLLHSRIAFFARTKPEHLHEELARILLITKKTGKLHYIDEQTIVAETLKNPPDILDFFSLSMTCSDWIIGIFTFLKSEHQTNQTNCERDKKNSLPNPSPSRKIPTFILLAIISLFLIHYFTSSPQNRASIPPAKEQTDYTPPLASAESKEGYALRSIFREDWETARRVYGDDWLRAYNALPEKEQKNKAVRAYIDRAFHGNRRAAAKWHHIEFLSPDSEYYEKIRESSIRQKKRFAKKAN